MRHGAELNIGAAAVTRIGRTRDVGFQLKALLRAGSFKFSCDLGEASTTRSRFCVESQFNIRI
jgi:hypothetical protein